VKKTILLALLIGCARADAEDWQPVGQSGNQSFYFERTSHVAVPSGNAPVACLRYQPAGGCVAHVHAKIVYAAHGERGDGPDATRWVAYRLMSLSIDCTADRSQVDSLTTFFDDSTSRSASEEILPHLLSPDEAGTWIGTTRTMICEPVLRVAAHMAREAATSPPASDAVAAPATVLRILKSKGDSREFTVSAGALDQTYSVTVDGKAVEGPLADVAAYTVACELRNEGDYKHAALMLRPVAERGLPDAQYCLGSMYEHAQGVARNYAEAVKWYRKAADQKYAEAEYALGSAFYSGEGVARDEAESMRWWRLAAEDGSASAQAMLGASYDGGLGVSRDDAEAVRWYRMAADQGMAPAQYYLGRMYKAGRGVHQSDDEAMNWWRRAAESDYGEAQFTLGMMYVKGDGVRRNYEEAVKWLRRASQQGDATGQIALGVRYMQGQGVRKDPAQAYKWFSIAIANLPKPEDDNRTLAMRNRDTVIPRLSPEEITTANAMATECLAHNYKDCE